jgi:hypothetical protein
MELGAGITANTVNVRHQKAKKVIIKKGGLFRLLVPGCSSSTHIVLNRFDSHSVQKIIWADWLVVDYYLRSSGVDARIDTPIW